MALIKGWKMIDEEGLLLPLANVNWSRHRFATTTTRSVKEREKMVVLLSDQSHT